MQLSVLTSVAELTALRADWDELVAHSRGNEPMSAPDWLLCWWDVFGEGSELRACAFHRDGQLVGLVPARLRRHYYRRTLPFRRLELLGSGEREADEIASDYIGMIVAAGHEHDVAEAFVAALAAGKLGRWDELVFTRMHAGAIATRALILALRQLGSAIELLPQGLCYHAELPASWDEYLAALPSRHRYVVRRSLRELEAFSGGDYELHCVADRAELDRGIDILIELHRERWSSDGQRGVLDSPAFHAFHQAVMPRLLDRGALQLCWLEVRGAPIAALYSIVWNGRIYFYQSGRAMDLPAKLKPGIASHALAIQRAIAEGMREYDFLAGDARYKEQLATASRELVELRVVRPRSLREPVRRLAEVGIGVAQSVRARMLTRRDA